MDVRAAGPDVLAWLEARAREGYRFRQIRRQGDTWRFTMGAKDWLQLRERAASDGLLLRVERYQGSYFLFLKLKRHPGWLGGAILGLLLLLMASSFIWAVDVKGAETIPPDRIRKEAARLGVRPGALRYGLSGDRVASLLPALIPEIHWAEVIFRGVRAEIRVVEEKKIPQDLMPEGRSRPGDLVAARDGLVHSFLVLQGEAQVQVGQPVAEGMVLIRGRAGGEPVQARGWVKGLVWYDTYIEVQTRRPLETPVGAPGRRWILQAGRHRWVLYQRNLPPGPWKVQAEEVGLGPLRWIREEVQGVRRQVQILPPEKARAWAKEEALARVLEKVPLGAAIVDKTVRILWETRDALGVWAQVTVLEDIARFSPEDDGP
ncbi:MAG: sporulation protein YqfD [Clostridiales bacterium]|nr:sporulation protein YqfD [Clostridiales bacterium]